MKIEKILTPNPYVDELVYYCKILGQGCILKNEAEALSKETLESSKASNMFIACTDGIVLFEQLSITRSILERSSVRKEDIDKYVLHNEIIPQEYRKELISIASADILESYIELNNYYRMVNGTPDLKEKGIKITDWTPPADIIIDINKYVHEMNDSEIGVLDSYGIIDRLITSNPDKKYLNYLGNKKIDIYKARKAIQFQVLYLPVIESSEIYDRFKARLEINRSYCIVAIYSEAYKYGSDYYDAFICVLIIVMTMIDIISSIQELIARKEVFDLRSIQYIFQSYGMPFYSEIPLKYQISMMKNINNLIKYKSTTKSMVDICSLFGFENIEIFKYYILKDRKKDGNGNFVFNFKEIPDPSDPDKTIIVDDNAANYNLKFIRVPLEGNADDYLRDQNNHLNYDDVTLTDPTWDGDLPHQIIKSKIIEEEFTYLRTKYISIDTVYEVTKLSFEMPYFFNIIFDDSKLEEKLMLYVPLLNNASSFKLTDIFCYLFALTYEFNGIQDTIMDTTGKILHVKGFNFKADLSALGEYVKKEGFTLEELGVADFRIPKTSIMSYNQLLEIFIRNGKIREHVIKQLLNADNKKIYDIYYKLYDALMITDFTNNYFRDPVSGYMPLTYTEYLQKRDPILYISLVQVHEITDYEVKVQKISSIVNNIIYALDEFIDSDSYRYLYSNFPSVSGEHIKQYVVKVINFFKSYKVDMLGINTIYKFDDKLDNTIKIIDDLHLKYIYHKDEYIKNIDLISNKVNISPKEHFGLLEKIYLDIRTWVMMNYKEEPAISDSIAYMWVKQLFKEVNDIEDSIEFRSLFNMYTDINISESTTLDVNFKLKDSSGIWDGTTRNIEFVTKIFIHLIDKTTSMLVTQTNRDNYDFFDVLFANSCLELSDKVKLEESVYISTV